jgi:hypothetical protein
MARLNPGEGYRRLTKGEVIADGDEFFGAFKTWRPVRTTIGSKWGSREHYPTRRKVTESTKKPKEPAPMNLPSPRVLDPIYHMPKSTPKKKEATMTAKKPATVKPKAKAAEAPYRPTVGDVVKIVKDTCYHRCAIGTVLTIQIDDKGSVPYYPRPCMNHQGTWFKPEDCELVTKAADVVKAPKEAKPKPKYPAPRVTEPVDKLKITPKTTKAEITVAFDFAIDALCLECTNHAITGTKLDRALVDLKEAKKRIKELEAAK